MTKMNDVTNLDIEMVIASGQDITRRAIPMTARIASSKVEEINDPIRKAIELLAISSTMATLAAHILSRGRNEEIKSAKTNN